MTNRNESKNAKKPGNTSRAKAKAATGAKDARQAGEPSKLDRLVKMLKQRDGATIADLAAATGWQAHSVRGALAGSLKKKGHVVTSEKVDGVRRYRIEAAQ